MVHDMQHILHHIVALQLSTNLACITQRQSRNSTGSCYGVGHTRTATQSQHLCPGLQQLACCLQVQTCVWHARPGLHIDKGRTGCVSCLPLPPRFWTAKVLPSMRLM